MEIKWIGVDAFAFHFQLFYYHFPHEHLRVISNPEFLSELCSCTYFRFPNFSIFQPTRNQLPHPDFRFSGEEL
jgi:hypothetical protein